MLRPTFPAVRRHGDSRTTIGRGLTVLGAMPRGYLPRAWGESVPVAEPRTVQRQAGLDDSGAGRLVLAV